jgi:phosphoenolpyruvate-protein phosphotransferase/dihydroxyacetone kinase phosphotransfer subunit
MIGIVVVSHSPQLARAAVDLALEMVPGAKPRIAIAAGAGDSIIGTDATKVAAAIEEVASPDGVLVMMDLGSALLSAELALEFVSDPSIRVKLTSAPFVEGLLAGVVRAAGGASLDEVEREASGALAAKTGQLGDAVPEVAPPGGAEAAADVSADLTLHNPSGLHIRPAAMIAQALAGLDATVMVANIRTGAPSVNANSTTSLLTLAARKGDAIRVSASGVDASVALGAVRALVEESFGEELTPAPVAVTPAPRRGGPLGVSPGRAVGPVVLMTEPLREPQPTTPLPVQDRPRAVERINAAVSRVVAGLTARAGRVTGEARDIIEATVMIAADPGLLDAARADVLENGTSPETAVWLAIGALSAGFAAQGGRIAERVSDLEDVRDRVLAALLGRPAPGVPERSEPFVLVARDLAPADTALLDPALCVAIVTVEGGPTSHTAILSRSLGIPAIVALRNALEIPEGTIVFVDGASGELELNPSAERIAGVRVEVAAGAPEFDGVGQTSDGHRVQLLANVGSSWSVQAAIDAKAEGVGLFRTEFLFLERTEAPTIDEQVENYRAVFSAFPNGKVIIRTLDAGADKPLAFVTLAEEANPALGIRGFRTSWDRPDLLDDQLEAIATAAAECTTQVQVMAPMIDTPDEAAEFADRARAHGLSTVGVMIETPAAAITATELFNHVDFVSLGTNDLAQYTMAADRLVGALAELNDPWQPAVLRMMKLAFDAGNDCGKPVGVCGEVAADPLLAAVLVGFGASSLSMTARALGHVSKLLGAVTLAECRAAALAAASARSASDARSRAASALRFSQ